MAYPAQTRLGIAPAVIGLAISTTPIVKDWLFGHSTMYDAMKSAIPELGQRALNGDVCAYVVLRAWSGDEAWCPLANAQCGAYEINMPAGNEGPCGAAPGLKPLAAEWRNKVDVQRNDVAATAGAMFSMFRGGTGGVPGDPKGEWWIAREAVTPSPPISTYTDYSGIGPVSPLPGQAVGTPAMASIFGNISPTVLMLGAGVVVLGLLMQRKG